MRTKPTKVDEAVGRAVSEARGDVVRAAHRALKALDVEKLSKRDAAALVGLLSKCVSPHQLLRWHIRNLPELPAEIASNVIDLDVVRARR